MSSIHSISPIDGRYAKATQSLQNYFSEAALIRYRLKVEIEYLKALSKLDARHKLEFVAKIENNKPTILKII